MAPIPNPHETEIADIVARFDLLAMPVDLFVRGLNGDIDYDGWPRHREGGQPLLFGHRYRVRKSFKGNRKGGMSAGDEGYFLGQYFFPYDGGLRLSFEGLDGEVFHIEFETISPATSEQLNAMPTPEAYFELCEDTGQRALELGRARDEIVALQRIAKDRRDAEHEAARPEYERRTSAAVKIFRLPDLVAMGFVDGGSLDYEHLHFGARYRVIKRVTCTRDETLEAGQTLRFLGAYLSKDCATALYFELADGTQTSLWFVPDARQRTGHPRYFRDPAAHLKAQRFDVSKRRKNLLAAKAVLLDIRKKREA